MENNTVIINAQTGEVTHTYVEPIEINEEIVIDYDAEVNRLIRQRYTASQEFAILRQRDEKPDEFAEYNEYCEWCKSEIKRIYEL